MVFPNLPKCRKIGNGDVPPPSTPSKRVTWVWTEVRGWLEFERKNSNGLGGKEVESKEKPRQLESRGAENSENKVLFQ